MMLSDPSPLRPVPAIRRLEAIAELDAEALRSLELALGRTTSLPARGELLTEGEKISGPLLLLDGWAARVRFISDGRRQIIGFVLPGDLIGNYGHSDALATSTVVALTDVAICALPHDASGLLQHTYAISRALDEAYLMAQVVRLGRLDAAERIIDLLLELHERLALAGLASSGQFQVPLTQELFADALGLTSVHVNRMIQQARKRGELVWAERKVHLLDPEASRRLLGREIPKVT